MSKSNMYCSPYSLASLRWEMIVRYEHVDNGNIISSRYPWIVIQFTVSFQSLNGFVDTIVYLGYTNKAYSSGQTMFHGEVKNVPVENLFCGAPFIDYQIDFFKSKYPHSKIPDLHYYNNNGDDVFSSIRRFKDFPIVLCTYQYDLRETLYEFLTDTASFHYVVTHCCLHSQDEILSFVPDSNTPVASDFSFSDSLPCGVRSLSLLLNKVDIFFTKCSDIPESDRSIWQENSDFLIDFELGVIFTISNYTYRFKSHFISSPDFHAVNAYSSGSFDNRPSWNLLISEYVSLEDFQSKMVDSFIGFLESYTSFPVVEMDSNFGKQFSPVSYKPNFLMPLESF